MNDKIANIIEQLKSLTLLEAGELVKEIEQTFGVDTTISAAPVMVSSTNNTSVEEKTTEEKTAFDIELVEVPADKKIAVLKIIRNVTGLGLKESKDIVDNVPKMVKEGASKQDSEAIKKELEEAGAKVAIK